MNHIKIKCASAAEYTLVSNQFIDRYLAGANDAQIKVYLFLLRHLSQGLVSDISDMADLFNYSEKDILRALSYWEKAGLMSLSFNSQGHLAEVSLSTLQDSEAVTVNTSKSPEAPSLLPNENPVPEKKKYHKPDYTLDQLTRFQKQDSTSQVLFIAESYLGKTLSANDVRSMLFISEELHFSFDLLDYLLQYCIDRGKKDFRYIEKARATVKNCSVILSDKLFAQITDILAKEKGSESFTA